MKLFKFISQNILFILTLFLLAFIPLYPKLPIVNVQNTWVYIRLEDFAVLGTLGIYLGLFIRKRVSLKTPLTMAIFAYWVIGAIATLHGVMILFPMLQNVFPNVALLSFIRRIEYMSLFFVAYSGMKGKGEKYVVAVAAVLVATLLGVIFYGFGQHYLGFPAYLTMNEEFAKGVPIQLSALSRVPSTFAGQYDLAAYLVLIIPIIVSFAFGFRNLIIKALLLVTAGLGFGLLFLTVSRVSFFVLLVSLALLLILQRKKWIIFSFIVLSIVFAGVLATVSPRLLQRFQSTVTGVNVLVDARSGVALGQVKQVSRDYFKDRIVTVQSDSKVATGSSSIVPFDKIPQQAQLLLAANVPNGETLPQGTSYINLPLSPVVVNTKYYYIEKDKTSSSSPVQEIVGDFVVKNARAYDLSFTTRFQGEWPRTFLAFERNIFLGSGYGSVSLAVDNDFLRVLGETGLLGFLSFAAVFASGFIFIRKIYNKVDSPITRSLILGFLTGSLGLILNAILIDVFEASKIAFLYWMLMGVVLGAIVSYRDGVINIGRELVKMVTSSCAVLTALLISTFALFWSSSDYYFAGDDFTWLRWVSDCKDCLNPQTILSYFTSASGFFYRPGTKVYFDLMQSAFWLNQGAYHAVSIIGHFLVCALLFLIFKKIFKNYVLAVSGSFMFMILSGYLEAIFWISATGFIINAFLVLLSLLLFIYWKENKKIFLLAGSVISMFASMFFHEVGVVAPLIVIAYDVIFSDFSEIRGNLKKTYPLLLSSLVPYLALRLSSQSHWFNGDYSYNLAKLPLNAAGNILGYLLLTVLGPSTLSSYEKVRGLFRVHVLFSVIGLILAIVLIVLVYKKIFVKLTRSDRKIILFALSFFVISLLPFLGLGNITSRYSYLSSISIALLAVFLFKKLYEFLLENGKQIAVPITFIAVIIFSSLHLFQLQKTSQDWYNAGIRTRNILISIEYIYAHYAEFTKEYYFVNVPIKQGDAWVFPVGIQDAAWLDLGDNDVNIHQANSLEDAFALVGDSNAKVFLFDKSGYFVEYIKSSTGQISPFLVSPALNIKK